jgi:hypothetical protein
MVSLHGIFKAFGFGKAARSEYSPDFSTPEGAIRALENAYRAKDIELAVAAKSFELEARVMLLGLDALANSNLSNDLITQTAEVLELAYRKEIVSSGFPDFVGVESKFSSKREVLPGVVEVKEQCRYPDGQVSAQRIMVGNTGSGWRVLNPT